MTLDQNAVISWRDILYLHYLMVFGNPDSGDIQTAHQWHGQEIFHLRGTSLPAAFGLTYKMWLANSLTKHHNSKKRPWQFWAKAPFSYWLRNKIISIFVLIFCLPWIPVPEGIEEFVVNRYNFFHNIAKNRDNGIIGPWHYYQLVVADLTLGWISDKIWK